MMKFFTRDSHSEWDLVGGPTTSPNKSMMADGGHTKCRKM